MSEAIKTILICTVGGSHKPIVTSIQQNKPDHICFICSEDDPATNKPGSYTQITGKGFVITEKTGEAPSLPNIPTQCNIPQDCFEVLLVSADDLDDVFIKCFELIGSFKDRFPHARIIADYTGGTKSMSAGLALASLEYADVELILVTGARANLIKVHDGTQQSVLASADRIRLHRQMAPYLYAWKDFAYGQAFEGLKRIPSPKDRALRAELQIAMDLSRCFDLWDRFNHIDAKNILGIYGKRLKNEYAYLMGQLAALATEDIKNTPARILDLWLNAQRRAAQARYDDAVARCYRLLEWISQWFIRNQWGLETSAIPYDMLPSELQTTQRYAADEKGMVKLGLLDSWSFIYLKSPENNLTKIFEQEQKVLRNLLIMRNHGILAHGTKPVSEEEWKQFADWMAEKIIPSFANEAGLKVMPKQLPSEPCWG